jgi:murein L,D-transpeptidase YcbB/YkuD
MPVKSLEGSFLQRTSILLLASALALSACGTSESAHSVEWAEVNPDDVTTAALKAAVKDEASRAFYQARNWKAVWTDDLAQDLADTIRRAPEHALLANMFLPEASPDDPARREATLTKAALTYGSALARGRVDPAQVFEVYTLPRPTTDVVRGLAQAIADENVGEWLAGLAPQNEEYRALSKAFLHYAQLASARSEPRIGPGEALKPGMSDQRVPRLIDGLKQNGYLPADYAQPDQEQQFTLQVAQAVKALQRNYGLEEDGVVGADTLAILNTSAEERARQIAVNMERRRWLAREAPATRIDVNTAATFLEYWRNGQLRNRRVVVVGQPDWETPQLGSPMTNLVLNPTWTVPDSIEKDELAGKSAAYFASQRMVRKNGRIVQMPGPKNALGQVKFDLKNNQAIYLHDTPAKTLFASNERHASHGCVRVSDALGFAQLIANDQGVLDRFREKFAAGDTNWIPLKQHIPVRLLYHTAYLEEGRQIRFRTDAYGWDDLIAASLGRPGSVRQKIKRHSDDVGP